MAAQGLATGCQDPALWAGMNTWEEWGQNFLPRVGDALCRAMGGHEPGGFPDWAILLIMGLLGGFVVINVATVSVPYIVLLERKLLGRFQHRIGPNRVGPFGLLQPIADAVKLMAKEDTTPRAADRPVFTLAPLAFAAPVLLIFAVIPWAQHAVLADLDIGIFYVLAIGSSAEVAVFMAGWASNNKFALFGAMRAVALLVSYEIPLILAAVGVVALAGTMSLSELVEGQRYIPNLLWQPLGFLIFVVAVSAELSRAPFDLLEADSEIVAGFHTEYSGMKWGLIQLGEYGAFIAFSAIVSSLYLSGWKGPFFLPGFVWLGLKMLLVITVFIWVRATVPRLRIDQIMAFGWKFLLPLSLINIFVTGAEVVAYLDGLPEWLIAVNFGVAAVSIAGLAKLAGLGARTPVLEPAPAAMAPVMVQGVRPVARGS